LSRISNPAQQLHFLSYAAIYRMAREPDSVDKNGTGNLYSNSERRVLELIPVLGSQPAGDVSHKPGGRLPLLFARPAVTPRNP